MKGKIFLVPFGKQGTTEFLLKQAIQEISGKNFSDILYLGPTPRKIRDAQISFTTLATEDNTFIPPKFYTIKQYTNELFQEYNQTHKILSNFIKPLLIQKLKPNISIGYAQVIAEFIRETKQYITDYNGFELEKKILHEISSRGCNINDDTYQRIQETLQVRNKYNKILKENKWLDSEDIAQESLTLIKDKVDIKTLVLDGFFYDLTRPEEKIVTALINKAEKVYAVSFYDERTPASYALPQEFLKFLRRLNELQEEKISDLPDLRTAPNYYVCPSIEDEVEFIASQIKHQFLNKTLSLNRTIVCFSRLNDYETTVRRTFDKYQIPYSIYFTKNLSKTQPVIAILELLRAIINNYPRLSTVAVLSSKYFDRFSQDIKESINYLSKKGGIIKSANQWKALNSNLTTIFQGEYKLTPTLTNKINSIQKEINTFLVLSERFSKPMNSLGKYTQSLRQLISQFQWCEPRTNFLHGNNKTTTNQSILHDSGKLVRGESNDNDKEITSIKNEFYNVLTTIENFEDDFGEVIIPLEDYLKILEYFLDQVEILPEVKIGGVSILGFLETRGLDCDNLFFGGLSEDKFPGQTRFDPILPEWLKQKLELPSIQRHQTRSRFHYFRLVNTARLNTFLSFYNTDQDRLLLPSPFLTGEAQTPIKTNSIFSIEQLQQEQGKKEKIDISSLITPVNFSTDKEVQDILNKRFGPKSKPSVTKLESYTYCPYLFYLQSIMEIEPIAEPIYEVEATLWGNIAHQVLERLYRNGAVSIEQISDKLEKILGAVLKENKLSQFWKDVAKKIFLNFIPYFVKNEQDLRVQGFEPFSIENRLQASITKGMTITGRIDRIDRNQNTNQLLILDYKTGRFDSFTPSYIEKGVHLQLPLYAFLVKKKFRTAQIADAGIYSILDNNIHWLIKKDASISDLISHALRNAQVIIQNIRQGRFNIPPFIQTRCDNCDYASFCPTVLNANPEQEQQNNDLTLFDQ
jgi:ATP-dependent helicase/DNAse subunit B